MWKSDRMNIIIKWSNKYNQKMIEWTRSKSYKINTINKRCNKHCEKVIEWTLSNVKECILSKMISWTLSKSDWISIVEK
jgi:hypothetical protein